MQQAIDGVTTMVPALLFQCAGVPLAALLDRLGFFDAVAVRIARPGRPVPVGALWLLAAATTAVLNLDTTVVLLTPLYIRLARRSGADPLPVALVPLLLAALPGEVLGEPIAASLEADATRELEVDRRVEDELVDAGEVPGDVVGDQGALGGAAEERVVPAHALGVALDLDSKCSGDHG